MTVLNRPVTSREYKLILRPEHFASREAGAAQIWSLITYLATMHGGEIDETQDKEKVRQTQYWDTPLFGLRHHGYALRLRQDNDYKLTLKYRGRDRYLSAARDLATPHESESKFEEDILPLHRNFAQSTSIEREEAPAMGTVAQITDYFPGLRALAIPADTPLQLVNGFTAHEVTRWIGKLRFGDKPKVKVSLSFWYTSVDQTGLPLVAELSYDYDLPDKDDLGEDALERYPNTVVDGAERLFGALQKQTTWIDLSGTTKTAFAYNGF